MANKTVQELKTRWAAPTPKFWATWIKYLTVLVSGSAAALATIYATGFEVYPVVIQILQGIIIIGAACGVQAKLTKP